jgi:hypothetical protein
MVYSFEHVDIDGPLAGPVVLDQPISKSDAVCKVQSGPARPKRSGREKNGDSGDTQ